MLTSIANTGLAINCKHAEVASKVKQSPRNNTHLSVSDLVSKLRNATRT